MNIEKTWKPLSISGAVLVIHSAVFSTIVLATGSDAFWGVGIGCFGAGFPLLTLGLLQHKKLKSIMRLAAYNKAHHNRPQSNMDWASL